MVEARRDSDVISIVGGGWSFSEVDPEKLPGTVIAINDAAVHLPRWGCALSMDRKWTENRWRIVEGTDRPVFLRDKNKRREWPDLPHVVWFKCDHESVIFGQTSDHMAGDNSGTVGMNLAYIAHPREVYLFGFDMCAGPNGEAHWYPMYPWRSDKPKGTAQKTLLHWAGEMRAVKWQFDKRGIKVVNVSSRSKIEAFERVHPRALGVGR
jgi:hypothetical protein